MGSGSVGVRLCRSRHDAHAHAEDLLRRTVNERGEPEPPDVVIEEYVRGPEFSVEVLCGRAIGITAKHLSAEPYFVETGHDFPAPLPAHVQALGLLCWRAIARRCVSLHEHRHARPGIPQGASILSSGA
jgi:argininosuccinate lyase